MSKRNFPDFLRAYIEYSKYSEAPDKFHFWTGVSAVAGALRRKVHIDMGYFKWHPNFYIIFVAPPGIVSKSSTASIGMDLLKKVKGIKFGADATTWQALAQTLAKSSEIYTTPEGQLQTMCSLTLVSSELGTLLNPSDNEMMDVLVSLWDGQEGTWSKATKTQGNDDITNPWINIIGCTTPAWIGQHVPEYIVGGGFTSRTIFVYADKKRRLVAYPNQQLPRDHEIFKSRLIEDLTEIANMCGTFRLTPDAIAYGEKWYEEHYTNPAPHLMNNRYGGYVARKQTHIHKLAMILAAARGNDLIITQEILEAAQEIVTATELDMPKVFAQIGADENARKITLVINHVRAHGAVDRQDLVKYFITQMGLQDIQNAIQAGIMSRDLTLVAEGATTKVVALHRPDRKVEG